MSKGKWAQYVHIPEVQEWLDRYNKNQRTKRQYETSLALFLKGVNLSEKDFTALDVIKAENIVLKYQSEKQEEGLTHNAILSVLVAPRSLFSHLRKPMRLKKQLVDSQEAQHKHVFSNGDLAKMFEISDVRGKALISLGASLGWSISDVLALDRKKLETEIERAKEANENFVFFNAQRHKTNAKTLAVINPLAIEWLSKWFSQYEGPTLFDLGADGVNKELHKIAEEAQIKTTGNVSFHCFRSWVMSSLIKAGFSEPEAKIVVGKKIPLTDATYLHIEEEVKEKYKARYEKYLSILKTNNGEAVRKTEELERQLELERNKVSMLMKVIEKIVGPEKVETAFQRTQRELKLSVAPEHKDLESMVDALNRAAYERGKKAVEEAEKEETEEET